MEGYQEVATFFEGSGLLDENLEMSIEVCFVCTCFKISIIVIMYLIHVCM